MRSGHLAQSAVRAGAALVPALAVVHAAPVISTFGPLRNRVMPRLSGQGGAGHVALTFDDGPDPTSTPPFLRLLEARGIQATFFMLGRMLARSPGLAKEMAGAGHEIAIHGWAHRPLLLRGHRGTYDDLARARDATAKTVGEVPRLFRPPYGVMTASTYLACRRLGLSPTLWTAWGEDWRSRATPQTVYETVTRDLHGGGTILLHDSDCTSASGSWRSTLGALPALLDFCEERGLQVGPLRDHGTPSTMSWPPADNGRGEAGATARDQVSRAGA